MRTKFWVTLLVSFFLFLKVNAQDESPLMKGSVNVSVKQGTIACDLILSNLPNIQDYVIRLNSGMNIRFFKDVKHSEPLYYDTDMHDTLAYGATMPYYLHENIGNPGKFLPGEMEVKYVGMFPVCADSVSGYQAQDARTNIAFNGYSLRADGLGAAWYPTLYDPKKKKLYEKLRYDLTVTCVDCAVLFINGSAPVKGTSAHFVSKVAHEPVIYCGNFEAVSIKNTWLLNPDMNKEQQISFLKLVNSFKTYYETSLGIPYNGSMTFVQTSGTAGPGHAFAFVASPTIFNVGLGEYGLSGLFDKKKGDRMKQVMAHELGHYYFGTYLRLNTEFGHIIDEGFAEYLSFKATKKLLGDSSYVQLLHSKLQSLQYFKPLALSKIKDEADYKNREFYLYYFMPVILTAIEKEIGEKTIWKWLSTLLNAKADFTDYAFFEKTFDAVITDKELNTKIKQKYFKTDDALKNAEKTIGENAGAE